jgi:hypothetical protein
VWYPRLDPHKLEDTENTCLPEQLVHVPTGAGAKLNGAKENVVII